MAYIDLNTPGPTAMNDLTALPSHAIPSDNQVSMTVGPTTVTAQAVTDNKQGQSVALKQPVHSEDLLTQQPNTSTVQTHEPDGQSIQKAPEDLGKRPTVVKDGVKEFNGPVVREIDLYLNDMISKNASDLHIAADFPPTCRIDGTLVPLPGGDLTTEDSKRILESIMTDNQKQQFLKDLDIDFSYEHSSGNRFRVNIFHSKGSYTAALRLIPSKIRSISELGIPNIAYQLIKRPHGLVLFTGPTGSGKSTSIAAMVDEINISEPKHIITIEDPIEYIFPLGKAVVNQREIGKDVTSWKRALRELLREDPNIVVIGEMRDFETIAATLTVAETGHLVFATLHTNSASQTIDRIIDVFPDAQQHQIRAQLANVLEAVISQRLVPLVNGGRKAVFEVMTTIPAVRNAIREDKTYQIDNIIQTNLDQGMMTLEKSLALLVRNGEISIETARDFSSKPDQLDSFLKSN